MKKHLINLKRRLTKYMRLSWKIKIVLLTVFFLMGLIRLAILVVPFKHLASRMGKEMSETSDEVGKKELSRAYKVGWCINKMSDFTPWESKCLVQALTAQIILKSLHIPSTLYLGITRESSNKLIAHAWLRCGQLIVTGAQERERFKVVAKYACH